MKIDRRKRVRIAAAVLTAAIMLSGCSYNSEISEEMTAKSNKKKDVYIITKSTTSAFFQSVYSGPNAASSAYNMNLIFEGPENEEDYEAQNEIILEAAKNGCEAIILSAADYHASTEIVNKVAKEGIDVIIIDSDIDSDLVKCRIGTDNYNAGCMAGEALLQGSGGTLNVGIVNFDENTANGQEREWGFRDTMEKNARVLSLETINIRSTVDDAKEGTKQLLAIHPEINAIVTFNEWTSLGVGYAIQELGLKDAVQVVAFDSNLVSVGMLETGYVDALVVQNPYAMGYLGVETAYKLLNGYILDNENIDTSTMIVTRETMYTEESQKMLFVFE